jgi:hypothetical protein
MGAKSRRCVPVLEQCEPRFLPSAIPVHGRGAVISQEVRIMPVTVDLFRVDSGPKLALARAVVAHLQPRPHWG